MDKKELVSIVNYIINQGLKAIKENTKGIDVIIDYVAICSRDEDEFTGLRRTTQSFGKEVDTGTAKTGHTFLLDKPIITTVGPLRLVKIRKPDPTRPQRGAPDFKVKNYKQFKDKYLRSSGNFTLMLRKDYEMVEIKGVNVLVYIPNKTLSERLKK